MPYKIYTYADPYRLDEADFWNEICSLPHFCGARTLVNGLKDVLKDKIKGLICPLDALTRHSDVYKSWTDDIGLRIRQYSALTKAFRQLLESGKINEKMHLALSQNQNYFLEAIRLFVELNIPAAAIDWKKGNTEQQLFVSLLARAQRSSLFSFPEFPTKEKLKDILVNLAEKEVEDCQGSKEEKQRCDLAKRITQAQSLNAIVVHGVHQFSPAQLRMLMAMDKMGITIIYLFNYQKEFSKVYTSWMDIYSSFDAEIHHDTNITSYQMPTMRNASNALACAIGQLCEDNGSFSSPKFRKLRQLYENVEFIEFANITEYAHFVSNKVEKAKRTYSDSRDVMERGEKVWRNRDVLRCLEEQVYTANRDIHALLNIYYPEFSQDRHFLSYPIGQFFSAIYRLWDYEKGCIAFDTAAIKECLSSRVLKAAPGEVLLRTFCNISILFEQITTYEEFESKIAKDYLENYDDVVSSRSPSDIAFRQLGIYNKYKVAKSDLVNLIKAIREINEIATYLFRIDNTREDFINFGKHFTNLESFLRQRELDLANEKERELITALQNRLDQVKPEKSEFFGTFRDLRSGIYFYLKQKGDAEQGPDWIVKNFEQIDGDILLSKRQFEEDRTKTYHFACLSDRDMNMSINDQLPWPLTDEFLSSAYLPQDLQFQVYCKTLDRRSDFLRYALFYGLCYNRGNLRLSYVRQYADEITEPYVVLSILGLNPKSGVVTQSNDTDSISVIVKQEEAKTVSYDDKQAMSMFLCPYRYFLDYVTSDSPVIKDGILLQKFFENALIEATWKRIEGKTKSDAMHQLAALIDAESSKLEPRVKFWSSTEIFDLKKRALHYLEYEVVNGGRGNTVARFNDSHMQKRKLFGAAKFVVDISEREIVNPFGSFECLANRQYPNKEYSLHSIPTTEQALKNPKAVEKFRADIKDYINQTKTQDKVAIAADWCSYCPHRGMCVEPYLTGGLSSGAAKRNRRRTTSSTVRKDSPIVISETGTDSITIDNKAELISSSDKESTHAGYATEWKEANVSSYEAIISALQKQIADNSNAIETLQNELANKAQLQEDASSTAALLEEQRRKSQELAGKLEEAEARIEETEARNMLLVNKVKKQEESFEKAKSLEFTEDEIRIFANYSAAIVFDTCSIMNYPNLLDGVNDGELVVVPKAVNNELENHKVNHYYDDRKFKAQRAITAIYNYKKKYPLIYADSVLELIPAAYRANEGEIELEDNKILSVAIRFRRYSGLDVVFITDDRSLSNKASGEDIEVWTSKDFVSSTSSVQEKADTVDAVVDSIASMEPADNPNVTPSIGKEKEPPIEARREELLGQKIGSKNLRLDARQISILQNNGVKTISDFLKHDGASFSKMKVKKGVLCVQQLLKEQERLHRQLDALG